MNDDENQYKPDVVSHPGETLLETIQALGISPSELALKTGILQEVIELVISGRLAITFRMARQLEAVLDIPISFWMKRQSNYNKTQKENRDIDLLACKHQHKDFVSSHRSSKETNRVMICEECGRVFVRGTKEGVHFDVSFHIDDEAQLEMIGKWTRWINDTDY